VTDGKEKQPETQLSLRTNWYKYSVCQKIPVYFAAVFRNFWSVEERRYKCIYIAQTVKVTMH